MHSTAIRDSFGRHISIEESRFTSTAFAGLFPIANLLAEHRILAPAFAALSDTAPVKARAIHRPKGMFLQRLLGSVAGFEDLTDHDVIGEDLGFQYAVGNSECASSSTLCRFENSVSRHTIDALNQALLKTLVHANDKFGFIPAPTNDRNRCLILDVDSTHVDLYGDQENKSYNGHYQCSCLAPVLCFLNQWPVAVFNAAGTRDARSVLKPQFERLVKNLKKAFPGHTIVFRGDSGFNSSYLMDACNSLKIFFITGLPPNKAAQRIAKHGLRNRVRKTVKRFTTGGYAKRTVGELVGYQSKSWKDPRRIVARKQFDPKRCQLDLRLIQTNIRRVKRGQDGFCPFFSKMSIVDLYEVAYCQRGRCELSIEEFKSECFGGRASATRFLTNSYRMLLAAFCQFVLKLCRFVLLSKKTVLSVRNLRRNVILVTAKLRISSRSLFMTLPSFMLDAESFFALYKVPIH